MIVYLDTSSLVKLYVEEEASHLVRELVERAELVATSVVAYAEARATLARQRREGGLTAAGFSQAKNDFEQDWPRYLAVDVNEAVYRRAGDLAEKHRLRGFDSLHLASYLSLFGNGVRQIRFSSFDKSLNRAARKETKERYASDASFSGLRDALFRGMTRRPTRIRASLASTSRRLVERRAR